jgi:hypothetical protein
MKEVYRKLRIDVGTDYMDYDDKLGFIKDDLLSALMTAYQYSKDLNKPVKVVWDIALDNDEYKQIIVATVDYKKFQTNIIDIKPKKKKQTIDPDFFGAWADIIKNL